MSPPTVKFCEIDAVAKVTFAVVATSCPIAISLALTVTPVPAPIFNVLSAAIVPPPVKPLPAITLTLVWSMCSFATKFVAASWSTCAEPLNTPSSSTIAAAVIEPPNDVDVPAIVIAEFVNFALAIEPANISFSTEPLAIVKAPPAAIVASPDTAPKIVSSKSLNVIFDSVPASEKISKSVCAIDCADKESISTAAVTPVKPEPSPINEPVKEPVMCDAATDESLVNVSTIALPVFKVDVPLSMFPNPLEIAPVSNVPTDVICVCDASTLIANVPSPVTAVRPVPATSAAASTAGPFVPPTMILPFVVNANAPTASVPLSCEIRTALSVKELVPIPPCATDNAVSKLKDDSSAEEPLTIIFFQLAILLSPNILNVL